MNCPHCQIALPPDARYCSGCGKEVPGTRGPAPVPSSKWVVAIIIAAGAILMVMVMGIIAAIAIPNFLNAVDRGKQKRSMADLRSIGTAIEAYAYDKKAYPVTEDLGSLQGMLQPAYLKTMPMADGWGNPFHVMADGTSYWILSGGKDGVVQGCEGGATQRFDADICFSDGSFVQWPEGMQQ